MGLPLFRRGGWAGSARTYDGHVLEAVAVLPCFPVPTGSTESALARYYGGIRREAFVSRVRDDLVRLLAVEITEHAEYYHDVTAVVLELERDFGLGLQWMQGVLPTEAVSGADFCLDWMSTATVVRYAWDESSHRGVRQSLGRLFPLFTFGVRVAPMHVRSWPVHYRAAFSSVGVAVVYVFLCAGLADDQLLAWARLLHRKWKDECDRWFPVPPAPSAL